MNVMVLGATGLTGGLVLDRLLEQPEVNRIVAPVRRLPARVRPGFEPRVIDFDNMTGHRDLFAVDVLICCLGTTLKTAGSRSAFRQVDYDYALTAARLAREAGARGLILMSAVGASARSRVFYSRVKGELEDAVRGLGFPHLVIYRPGLLLGKRQEHRIAESLGAAIMPLLNPVLIGPLQKYRAIEAERVAAAMVADASLLASPAPTAPTATMVSIREYPDFPQPTAPA